MQKRNTLSQDLKILLLKGGATTQESLCQALTSKGHQVNQSKISRLLRKLNAIKSKNEKGEMVYRLPHDSAPPPIYTPLSELILDILANETTIIIKCSPGSAQLIARFLDYQQCKILGTIAGDDSIFIAPQSVEDIEETLLLIKHFLSFKD
ncbi:ArgR family transcriptional regulator [Legionella israelensis]|uniref:Arginine repressor n=1 Tax=Legionella israelensis TaxID=454 RepID=A0AAX1EIJ9_9GAMM|nr:ArgR family transcriptional regulator [Legionella israelensis]QBR84931.1 ArgR family transcriptional regulator [Legionella israelensis]QDP73412.1 ArgR family transcriptional regulator [Legionella israelensis]